MKKTVVIKEKEYWWGGSAGRGFEQPYDKKSLVEYDMEDGSNQTMPLFVSNYGRYIWSDSPMKVTIKDGKINIESDTEIELNQEGKTLKEAYLNASRNKFPFSGKMPEKLFFETAQYNTWMEMDYNQSQRGVLKYAKGIIECGYKPGILMIDEGWQNKYGLWDFDRIKFPNPKKMVDELHKMGFIVMLWVVPFVSCDGVDFSIRTKPYNDNLRKDMNISENFLRTDSGEVALFEWWNGYSAILNMCKEEDRDYLEEKLQFLMNNYGIDGFKFDGGNISCYNNKNLANGKQTKYSPMELNIAWNEFGEKYKYHEYKDTFKGGGKATIQRIRDRNHSWDKEGIQSLIPVAITQGLIGHPFICPDMIGGGYWSLNYSKDFKIDKELFVRMAQCSAMFPMMQFSWAPWRVLDKKYAQLAKAASEIHNKFVPYLIKLIQSSAKSGEPIIRAMEYEYPRSGYENIKDQFMLGEKYLVCPVIKKGLKKRKVILPTGKWKYSDGKTYDGGKEIFVDAGIDVLPYFEKVI